MRETNITLWLQVGNGIRPFTRTSVDILLASSGACATIASDALMNPFDGRIDSSLHC